MQGRSSKDMRERGTGVGMGTGKGTGKSMRTREGQNDPLANYPVVSP